MKDLMQPRYKVIADYPDSDLPVDIVVTMYAPSKWIDDSRQYEFTETELWFKRYPHLFKKLEWWEERKQDEMPKYVKRSGRVFKIDPSAKIANSKIPVQYLADRDHNGVKNFIWLYSTLPATEQEYNDFINSKNINNE